MTFAVGVGAVVAAKAASCACGDNSRTPFLPKKKKEAVELQKKTDKKAFSSLMRIHPWPKGPAFLSASHRQKS